MPAPAAISDTFVTSRTCDGVTEFNVESFPSEENIDELRSDPDSMGDSIFRTFVTGFGEVDVVLRPAGFPNGYEDLIENAFMATIQDELEPGVDSDGSKFVSRRRTLRLPKCLAHQCEYRLCR